MEYSDQIVENNPNTKSITKVVALVVNYLFHPALLPLYLFAILLFFSSMMIHNTIAIKLIILKMVAIITLGMPLVSFGSSALIVKIVGERQSATYNERLLHAILAISYILVILILKNYITLMMILRLMTVPLLILLQYHLFSYYKIHFSLSMAGMGAMTGFMYLFSLNGIGGLILPLFVTIGVSGLVGCARLYLQRDNLISIAHGYGLGFIATVASFLYLSYKWL